MQAEEKEEYQHLLVARKFVKHHEGSPSDRAGDQEEDKNEEKEEEEKSVAAKDMSFENKGVCCILLEVWRALHLTDCAMFPLVGTAVLAR